jgi:hypothetical protein
LHPFLRQDRSGIYKDEWNSEAKDSGLYDIRLRNGFLTFLKKI